MPSTAILIFLKKHSLKRGQPYGFKNRDQHSLICKYVARAQAVAEAKNPNRM